MKRAFASPSRYIQGKGELAHIAEYVGSFGKNAFIVISGGGLKRFGDVIEKSFKDNGFQCTFIEFGGESSKQEVERVRKVFLEAKCDFVVGVGGGKVIDTAKTLAFFESVPMVSCPTIASSDAPSTAITVMYTPEGVYEEYLFLPTNPDLVLVDTAIIAATPVRFIVAGMGDTLATYYEARSILASDSPNLVIANNFAGSRPTIASFAIATACYDTLMEHGKSAVDALKTGSITPSVEKVIEANSLLSSLGAESVGVSAAHAIHNGLTALDETHHCYHGEKVSFGIVAQLILENYPQDEIEEAYEFLVSVGLPVTFKELNVENPSRESLLKVAELACAPTDTMGFAAVEVTPEDVVDAMLAADTLGKQYLGL